MAGLQPFTDKFANLLAADFFGFDLFPDFDWRVGGVAGAERRVELFERRLRVIDKPDLHRRLVGHLPPPHPSGYHPHRLVAPMSARSKQGRQKKSTACTGRSRHEFDGLHGGGGGRQDAASDDPPYSSHIRMASPAADVSARSRAGPSDDGREPRLNTWR